MTTTASSSAAEQGAAALPATLRLGAVHLIVADLDRSVAFYQRALGMRVHEHEAAVAELGDGVRTVLVLHEDPLAQPAGRHAGLYHYALLYPTREELARAADRLSRTRTPIEGASDHGTHEAIYLPDPDGNGIELAADRPREQWPAPEAMYAHGPQALDFDALLATIAGEEPSDHVTAGLGVGHVHLHVGDVGQGLAFYRDVLGFGLEANLGSAAFVAAGGYHHHVGFNVWRGRGAGPAPAHAAGLDHWTIELSAPVEVAAVLARVREAGAPVQEDATGFVVRDPWDIAVRVEARDAARHRSRAVVATAKPSPYLLQVCKHFRHKLDVGFDEHRGRIAFAFGAAELTAGEDALVIDAAAGSPSELRRVESVIAGHLERFGARDGIVVDFGPAS